jgi:8-oxo-dGTP pyrophosphatase MutT (NUDIX family)
MLIRDGTVLLVKHTYQPGWFLPGGGVRRKETLTAVAHREVWEEVGARLGELQFWGLYTNLLPEKSDHITVFLCHDYVIEGTPDFEIQSVQAFPLDRLPPDVSIGSQRRIEEFTSGDHQPGVGRW